MRFAPRTSPKAPWHGLIGEQPRQRVTITCELCGRRSRVLEPQPVGLVAITCPECETPLLAEVLPL